MFQEVPEKNPGAFSAHINKEDNHALSIVEGKPKGNCDYVKTSNVGNQGCGLASILLPLTFRTYSY